MNESGGRRTSFRWGLMRVPTLLRGGTLALWLVLLTLVEPLSLVGQEPSGGDSLRPGPVILELAWNPRAAAMGGAFWTHGNESGAVFHHPALLSFSGEGFGGSLHRFGSGATLLAMSGSGEWFGGAAGVGVALLEYGVTSESAVDLPKRARALAVGGGVAASEFVAVAGFAKEVAGVGVGGVVKGVGQRLGAHRGTTVGVDLGTRVNLGPAALALTVQNLGPGLELAGTKVPMARRVVLGAGVGRAPVGPFDIGAAVQVVRDGAGNVSPGGGVEIAWWPVLRRLFIMRIGAVRVQEGTSPFTFGCGFAGDRIRLDYAYQGFDASGNSHSFGIAFR